MSQVTIFHNPRCSKSRQTLALLKEQGIAPSVREYLKEPPSVEELKTVLAALDMQPRELLRTKEAEYAEMGLDNPQLDDERVLAAMVQTPKLIERPIVLKAGSARIGRPPESVLEIL